MNPCFRTAAKSQRMSSAGVYSLSFKSLYCDLSFPFCFSMSYQLLGMYSISPINTPSSGGSKSTHAAHFETHDNGILASHSDFGIFISPTN